MVYLCLSLLILVLLGELLVTLDDVGALGFAKNLYSEELKTLTKPFFLNTTLDFTASLALISRFSASHFLFRLFAFHSLPQAVCLPQPFWLLKIIQMTKNRW